MIQSWLLKLVKMITVLGFPQEGAIEYLMLNRILCPSLLQTPSHGIIQSHFCHCCIVARRLAI